MSSLFDQAFNEYQSKISNYQDAVNNYKAKLQEFRDRPGQVVGQILPEVGVPLAMELARKGLNKAVKGDPVIDSAMGNEEAVETPDPAEGSAVNFAGEEIQETSFPSETPTGSADASQVATLDSQEVGAPGTGTSVSELNDVLANRSEFSIVEPEAMPGTSSNIIGRLFSGVDSPMQAASNFQAQAQSAIDTVARVTGSTQEVAEDALQTGATAIRGGKQLVTGSITDDAASAIAATGEGAAETAADAGLSAAAAGAESFDPLAIAGGLLAAGIGSLVDALSDHKPQAVAIPNVAVPTFQSGLATSN